MIQGYIFRQKTNATTDPGVAKWAAKHAPATSGGQHKAHGKVNGGTLTGTVRSQETKYFSLFNLQAKPVEGTYPAAWEITIFLGYFLEFQRR
jgi:hypothetical protein